LLFPSDEVQIRRLLSNVAETASLKSNTNPLIKIGGANKLGGFFAEDAIIEIDGGGLESRTIRGREELVQVATVARASLDEVTVRLLDVQVSVDPDGQTAGAYLTALANVSGITDAFVQETRMRFVRVDDRWLISRVEPVKRPRLEPVQ
jgi:ketosteroid isomerase-like protein